MFFGDISVNLYMNICMLCNLFLFTFFSKFYPKFKLKLVISVQLERE